MDFMTFLLYLFAVIIALSIIWKMTKFAIKGLMMILFFVCLAVALAIVLL